MEQRSIERCWLCVDFDESGWELDGVARVERGGGSVSDHFLEEGRLLRVCPCWNINERKGCGREVA